MALLAEPLTGKLLLAGALMGVGLWPHQSERHEHRHFPDLHHRHNHG